MNYLQYFLVFNDQEDNDDLYDILVTYTGYNGEDTGWGIFYEIYQFNTDIENITSTCAEKKVLVVVDRDTQSFPAIIQQYEEGTTPTFYLVSYISV